MEWQKVLLRDMGNLGLFGAKAEQVAQNVDLTGKVAIVTGGNTGIGMETARVLAKQGAQVILACRNEEKSAEAVQGIIEDTGNPLVTSMKLDLSSFDSIRSFCWTFFSKQLPLHILVNNAGIMAVDWNLTSDGIESQFGVCHLGHFLLTGLLLTKLKESSPARVVVLGSRAHKFGNLQVLTPYTDYASYSRYRAYANAKLANGLFANEFNRRYSKEGVTANTVHPGVVSTELARNDTLSKLAFTIGRPFIKSVAQGAATSIYVATSPDLDQIGGKYFEDCVESAPSELALDKQLASNLWTLSEKMCSFEYDTAASL